MANKQVFSTQPGKMAPPTDVMNEAGGVAYGFTPKHALAQLAATGTLNDTFYATAEDQTQKVLDLARTVDAEFVAKTAVYARESGYMKDMPALLCAVLMSRNEHELLTKAFARSIDNGKMLRNFVQIVRSGLTGRKSLGSVAIKLVRGWFDRQSDEALFRASIGNDPSLADVIKMAHPRPTSPTRGALFGYLLGKQPSERDVEAIREEFAKSNPKTMPDSVNVIDALLPPIVQEFERFKKEKGQVPDVPFEMLTALDLDEDAWKAIARRASWTQSRMNLNTFLRHGVFADKALVKLVADKLRDPQEIKRARCFPYQLMAAFMNVNDELPTELKLALQDAMEIAVENAPVIEDEDVYLFPDVSGSMSSPITGERKGSTTKVTCIHVAGLMAAVFLRKNPKAQVIPFEGGVREIKLNPRDSIMTNAEKLAAIGGGSTNCSAPLVLLNQRGARGSAAIYISDNQSWIDTRTAFHGVATETMRQWAVFKSRSPKAKLVCIDIQAYTSTQAAERSGEILNIGGFSDRVFEIVTRFVKGELSADHWVGVINAIKL